jgi:hypothetical protein
MRPKKVTGRLKSENESHIKVCPTEIETRVINTQAMLCAIIARLDDYQVADLIVPTNGFE